MVSIEQASRLRYGMPTSRNFWALPRFNSSTLTPPISECTMKLRAVLSGLLALSCAPALIHAADATTPGKVIVERPTLQCLGYRWMIDGDDNRNAVAAVQYRRTGEAEFRHAQPMLRIRGETGYQERADMKWSAPNMFAGSILGLEPNTEYEVRLELSDPDGGKDSFTTKLRTRSEPAVFKGLRSLHVYPPEHTGKTAEPAYKGLAAAYRDAKPGDLILVHAGVYKVAEADLVDGAAYVMDRAAKPDAPIVVRAAGDGDAVIDGTGADRVVDCQKSEHHAFEGLVFRGGGRQIHAARGAPSIGLVVRGCRFEGSNYPIFALHGGCRDFYIADNEIVGKHPNWNIHGERKNDSHGVWIQGQGHGICFNRVRDLWDGINLYGGKPSENPDLWNCAVDIHNNDISGCADDGIELDYAMHNVRAWNNFVWNSFHGVSLQPIWGGPAYVLRNVVFNCTRGPLKPNQFPAGMIIVHNTFLTSGASAAFSSTWQNSQFFNNLFIGTGGSDYVISSGTLTPATSRMDHNGYRWYPCPEGVMWRFPEPVKGNKGAKQKLAWSYPTLNEFSRRTGHESHGLIVDTDIFEQYERPSGKNDPLPKFDARLKDGAKAIDAGLVLPGLNDGHAGKAPDLGAFERGSPLPHYGPRK